MVIVKRLIAAGVNCCSEALIMLAIVAHACADLILVQELLLCGYWGA